MNGGRQWSGIRKRIVTVVSESCHLLTAAARKTLISSNCHYRSDNIPGLKLIMSLQSDPVTFWALCNFAPTDSERRCDPPRYLPAPVSFSTPASVILGHADESVAPGLNPAALLILLNNDLFTNKPPNHFTHAEEDTLSFLELLAEQ